MGAPDLLPRVLDYFDRQIEWMREALRELAEIGVTLDENSLERLAEQQRRREAQYEHFLREYHGLLDEWRRKQDIPDREKRKVQERARHAQAIAAELAERYEQGTALLEREKARNQRAIQTLRRGKTIAGKYRTDATANPDFIDRDA